MATTLQIVDPDDLTTVWFDFNDPTGANNPGGLKTNFAVGGAFNLGAPDAEEFSFGSDEGGNSRTMFRMEPVVQSDFRMTIQNTSYALLREGVGALQRLLSQGGVIKYVPNNATDTSDTRYIDYFPSPLPAMLKGEEDELLLLASFYEPRGVQIVLNRRALLRGALLDSTANKLTNATLLMDRDDAGVPDGWSLDTTDFGSATINADDEAFQATKIATGTGYVLSQSTAVGTFAAGEVVTGSIYFRVKSGTSTSDSFRVTMLAKNSSSVTQGTYNGTAVTSPVVGQWYRLTVTATMPATTSLIEFYLDISASVGTGEVIQAKNAQLEKASAATPFRVGTETLSNDPTTTTGTQHPRIFPIFNPGDAPAPVSMRLKLPDAATKVTDIRLAAKGNEGKPGTYSLATLFQLGGLWVDFPDNRHGWTATTYGAEASTVSDAAGDDALVGGDGVRISHASSYDIDTLTRRVRVTRTADMNALRGTWRVFLVWRGGSDTGRGRVQLKWALTTTEPALYVERARRITYSGTAGRQAIEVGRITIPEDTAYSPSGLALELWESYNTQSVNVDFDGFVLLPAQEGHAHGVVSLGEGGSDSYGFAATVTPPYKLTADSVWTAHESTSFPAYLDLATEAIGLGSNSGTVYAAGHWKFTVAGGYYDAGYAASTFTLRVVSVGGAGAGSVIASKIISTTGTDTATNYTKALEFDADGVTAYQVQVLFTAQANASAYGWVSGLQSEFTPTLAQNFTMLTLPERGEAWATNASGAYVMRANVDGPTPLHADPGLNVVHALVLESPSSGGSDSREILGRLVTVDYSFYPRYYS